MSGWLSYTGVDRRPESWLACGEHLERGQTGGARSCFIIVILGSCLVLTRLLSFCHKMLVGCCSLGFSSLLADSDFTWEIPGCGIRAKKQRGRCSWVFTGQWSRVVITYLHTSSNMGKFGSNFVCLLVPTVGGRQEITCWENTGRCLWPLSSKCGPLQSQSF